MWDAAKTVLEGNIQHWRHILKTISSQQSKSLPQETRKTSKLNKE